MKEKPNSITAIVVAVLLSLNAFSPATYADHCKNYDKKIDKIRAKMRQGYTVDQGERLKKALTKWQDKRAACEKTKHPNKKKRTLAL